MIQTYNNHRIQRNGFIQQGLGEKWIEESDQSKIVWATALRKERDKNVEIKLDFSNCRTALYRPYCAQQTYYDDIIIDVLYMTKKLFPEKGTNNMVICINGIGGTKNFSCLITDKIPDLQLVFNGQCFPLYWYEENKVKEKTLFDAETGEDYIRRDGITDWILKEVRSRYGGAKNITKEMIFYYVYGLLHSPDYRERFAADLKKSLPRIPIVERVEDFMDFYRCGKKLAELHLNYEDVPAYPDVEVIGDRQLTGTDADYDYFRVVDKLRFKSNQDKSTIIYNGNIQIKNIPEKAYEYVVNGKSAIEWIVERYCVSQDKKSLIRNDANDWAREHHKPRYILDLLLSVINVSVQTVDIVNALPKLKFE